MTRYDPEIIAALAEGALDPEEAEALEREIAGDPVASATLAAQRMALEVMRETPQPMLTEAERSDLRRRIAAELGLAPEAATAPAPRRIAWGSIGIAAAALVGVIAVVPVVGLLTTSGDAGDAAAVSLLDEDAQVNTRADTPDSGAVSSMAEEALDTFEDTTADAAAPTTAAPATAAPTTSAAGAGDTTTIVTTTAAPSTTDGAGQQEDVAWLSGWRESSADPETATEADSEVPCFDQADSRMDDAGVEESLLVEPTQYEDTEVVTFYLVDEAGVVGPIAAFVTESCELIAQLD
jgi:hypothetical protein